MPARDSAPDSTDTTDATGVAVTHDAEHSRFVAELDGELAVAAYHRDGREVRFTHTEVPEAFEGRGVGSRLARTALDWAVGEGLVIVPQCGFIRAWVQRHPEYREHVAADWR